MVVMPSCSKVLARNLKDWPHMFGFFLNSRRLVGRRWIQWREWDWSRWVYYGYLQEILSVYVQYNLEEKTKPNQLANLVLFQCYKIEINFAKCRSLNSRCLWALAFLHFVQWAWLYCAFEFNIESVCIGNPQVTLDPKPKETVDWERWGPWTFCSTLICESKCIHIAYIECCSVNVWNIE